MTTRDVYIAIMVASAQGKGLRLTWEECFDLAGDDAIATRAMNALTKEEWAAVGAVPTENGWAIIDPRTERVAGNSILEGGSEAAAGK